MKQKRSVSGLGETEMEIMNHLWDLGSGTVADVHSRITSYRKVAYTTIMTVLKKLADKNMLRIEKEGLTYRYFPVRSASEVKGELADSFVSSVFRNSPVQLVQTLVKKEKLTESEIEELKKLIENL